MSRPDSLFSSGRLSDALRGRERELAQAAEAIKPDHALARSAEELTAELVERFWIEPLVLDWESKTASIEDAKVDVSGDFRRGILPEDGPVLIAGSRLTFRVPFAGERDLFKYRPSLFSNPPHGIVDDHDLRLIATAPVDQRDGLPAAIDAEIAEIKTYVGYATGDVEAFNKNLEGTARSAAQASRSAPCPPTLPGKTT